MGGKGSGRPVGTRIPGSFAWQLTTAKPGDRIWVEQDQRSASGTAWRAGVRVRTRAFTAVHDRDVLYLTCVEVLGPEEK